MRILMIDDLEQLIGTSVADVFNTMLNVQARREPHGTPITNGEPQVAGSVGFIGNLSGVVYLYSSNSFARRLTSGMLGLADGDIEGDEMVNDAVGELTNMVVGHIKSQLSDRGLPCVLTIPSIVRAIHFSIEPVTSTERRVFSFRCDAYQLVVEVLLKANPGAEQPLNSELPA